MLDAEISPTGTVTVEGHHVGELQAFRFTADHTAEGEDGKAVRAAAQKALASEFETRADRFAASGNGDFALSGDGLLRWIGAPVGQLTGSEDPLKPRVVLLADEQLTGPARDKVAARAERFVGYRIETLLKPLIDLKNADQLTGIARGIAFRLVENFGLVNRRDIADDMKALDQDGRAALRRLGVRFGAYHIFIPAMVKPAPAELATLLWTLNVAGYDKAGFGDVVNVLANGRTSVVVDPAFEPRFYALAGYRILGRRAVRVDILERLADLIRPALSWRTGTGKRPEGAYDGAAFYVTPAMMSILGATGEDMDEVLKGLGYRGEPKAPAAVKAKLDELDAAQAKAEADKATQAAAPVAEEAAPAADAEAADGEMPEADVEVVEAEAEAETVVVEVEAVAEPIVVAEPVAVVETVTEAVAAPAEAAEEPKPIMLWRPQRTDQRPRHQRDNRARGRNQGQAGQPSAEGEAATGGKQRFERRFKGGADGKPAFRKDGEGKPPFKGRPDFKGKDGQRRDGENRQGRPGGNSGGKPDFKGNQGKPREERPARFDPDSPFAKLAALRDQLRK